MITVVGEILVDLIEQTAGHPVAHPGGSPANVAVALARLGQPVNLLTQLSDDPHGQLLHAHLRDNNVTLAPGTLMNSSPTSVAHTRLGSDGQARYSFDITWQRFPAATATWPDPATTCVHTGSLATLLTPGADDVIALVNAARDHAIISFDPNCRPSLVDDWDNVRDRVAILVASSDIVKASLDDLAWLYPGRHYQDVGREWLDLGAGLVVITLGADGSWACTARQELRVGALPIKVVDTVGAGDTFTAGLLTALSRADLLNVARRAALTAIDEAMFLETLMFASRAAAVTCSRRGADPPTLADLGRSMVQQL